MDDVYTTSEYYSVAVLAAMYWYFWSAAMGVVAAWLWMRTRSTGALLMAVGFFLHFASQLINGRIPMTVQVNDGPPQSVHASLHLALWFGALAGMLVTFAGFVWMAAKTKRSATVIPVTSD